MVCATMNIVIDDVSAAKKYKKIDSYNYPDGGGLSKVTVFQHTKDKSIKIHSKYYTKNKKTGKFTKFAGTLDVYLTKTSRNKLRIRMVDKEKCGNHFHTHTQTETIKYKFSAKKYSKKYKPIL